jgi:hypothetical protein
MMHRRIFIMLLAISPSLLGAPGAISRARADDGGSDSSGSGSGGGNGSGDGNPGSGGKDGGEDGGENKGLPSPGESHEGEGPQGAQSGPADHDGARRAVLDKAAIPLTQMMAIFKKSITGEVVDVSLIHGDAALRYRFKYIDGQGHVRRAFFDALSGRQL